MSTAGSEKSWAIPALSSALSRALHASTTALILRSRTLRTGDVLPAADFALAGVVAPARITELLEQPTARADTQAAATTHRSRSESRPITLGSVAARRGTSGAPQCCSSGNGVD